MQNRPKTSDPLKAIAYVRVSTDRQALGPEAQRATIEAFAASQHIEIVAWEEDLGVSGSTDLTARPGLLAAIARLKPANAGVLLVAKRDRLARDAYVAATIDRAVTKQRAAILCADGIANGGSAADSFLRTILDGAAAFERALISQRTKAALSVKRARGEKTGGDVPYGYRSAQGALVAVASEQTTLATVRALRASGLSLRAIAAQLTRSGTLTRKGTPLTAMQIARMAG